MDLEQIRKEKKAERARRYRQKNREKVSEGKRKYYQENREKTLERVRKHKQENREKILEGKRKYRQENREKELERHRKYRQENREKILEGQRKYRQENQEKELERHRKKKYGVDSSFVSSLIQIQNNKCAICQISFLKKRLNIDHCHFTGRVRQLLCTGCNFGLGIIEKPGFLKKALAYIQHHKEQHQKEELGDLY